eukprot:3509144-Alexandrium_andersonii.AAC.2
MSCMAVADAMQARRGHISELAGRGQSRMRKNAATDHCKASRRRSDSRPLGNPARNQAKTRSAAR